MRRPGARLLCGLSVLGGLSALVACRGIAGIDDFTYVAEATDGASDGPSSVDGSRDAGSADSGACYVKPTSVYSTTDTLYNVFLAGGQIFFELYSNANDSTSVSSCDPASCVAITPYILADPILWTEDVTNTHVYWTDIGDKSADGGPVKNGALYSIAWPGGDAGPRVTVNGALSYPNYLKETADESAVFFTDDPNNTVTNQPGPATLLKCTLPTCANPVLWGSGFFTTYSVVMGTSRVFVMASSDLGGSKKALFACSQTAPCDMPPKKLVEGPALDSEAYAESNDTVFITSADQNAILQIAPSGTVTTFAANQTTPEGIGIDSGFVYWFAVTLSQGKDSYIADLRRKKIDGTGDVETVVCGLNSPGQLHFDSGFVYFTEAGSSSSTKVERIAKPK